ncbi:MAG: hypothetical protein QOI56_433 [Actinomycetota bacterium]|nr:hypothetical protein [Actinomycetota bacterium]
MRTVGDPVRATPAASRLGLAGLVILLPLVVGACRSGGSSSTSGAKSSVTTPTLDETTTIPVVVTLPPDSRPRATAVPATAAFDGVVTAQPSFEAAAGQVVAAVEQRYPGDGETQLRTDSSTAVAGTTGTVLVRRDGFADDSVAGYEYTVTVEQGPQGWVVASATEQAICYRAVSGERCA